MTELIILTIAVLCFWVVDFEGTLDDFLGRSGDEFAIAMCWIMHGALAIMWAAV